MNTFTLWLTVNPDTLLRGYKSVGTAEVAAAVATTENIK